MQPLPAQPNHYKKCFYFFFHLVSEKKKCKSYQQKKEKQNLMIMIWFLEKKFSLPSVALLSTEWLMFIRITNKQIQTFWN